MICNTVLHWCLGHSWEGLPKISRIHKYAQQTGSATNDLLANKVKMHQVVSESPQTSKTPTGITQKFVLCLALWVGRIVSIKRPAPLAPQRGIKAASASSLFQAKCYKLLYYRSTVKLKSSESGEKKKKTKPENIGKKDAQNSLFQLQLYSAVLFFFSLYLLKVFSIINCNKTWKFHAHPV